MKRDMDLVRKILLAVENLEPGRTLDGIDGTRVQDFAHHIDILCDAGALIGGVERDAYGEAFAATAHRLTWQGHDMLDSLRNGA